MRRAILALFLVMVMTVGVVSGGVLAFAVESDAVPDEIQDVYVYDGVTYFNVKSPNVDVSTRLFIEDCLSATNASCLNAGVIPMKSQQSTANLWQFIALFIQKQLGSKTEDAYFKSEFDSVFSSYMSQYTLGTFRNMKSGVNDFDVNSVSMQYASSMAQAGANIENKLYDYYDDAGGSRKQTGSSQKKSAVWQNGTLAGDTRTQDVFWSLISANKTSGTYKKGHYQATAVIFSDFTLSPITPEDEGTTYITVENDPVTSVKFSAGVVNDSSEQASASQTLTQSASIDVLSEVNGSETYTFGQAIGADFNFGTDAAFFTGTLRVDFTFEEALQTGWSNSTASSKGTEHSSEVAITVPAYTSAMIASESTTWHVEKRYNCPVALGFKVTVVEYTLDPSANKAPASTRVLAVYNDARTKLNQWGVTELNVVSKDGMNWASTSTQTQAAVKALATTAPISSTGAYVEVDYELLSSTINNYFPIYPLSEVKAVNQPNEIKLLLNEYIYTDEIDLEGYNSKGGVYYGFNEAKGRWILLDQNGAEIGNGNSDSAAVLETDPVTKDVTLKAQSAGTVYLKYLIDEDCYNTASKHDTYATNESISPAIIKVIVSGAVGVGPDAPTVEQQGEDVTITVTRNTMLDEIRKTDIASGLSGVEDGVVSYLLYDAIDDDVRSGQRLTAKLISDLACGTYFVRAKVGNHYSAAVTVILEETELSKLTIPNAYSMCEDSEIYLSGLYVLGYDQNGNMISVTDAQWHCDDKGAAINDNRLSFSEAGTYSVYALAGDVQSNEMKITVTAVQPETHSVTVRTEGSGTACSGQANALSGETVSLSADAGEGWHFVGWYTVAGTAQITDYSAQHTEVVIQDADVVIVARFAEDPVEESEESPDTGDFAHAGLLTAVMIVCAGMIFGIALDGLKSKRV